MMLDFCVKQSDITNRNRLSSAFYIFLELISQIRRIATLIENIKQAGIKCRRHGTWRGFNPTGFSKRFLLRFSINVSILRI